MAGTDISGKDMAGNNFKKQRYGGKRYGGKRYGGKCQYVAPTRHRASRSNLPYYHRTQKHTSTMAAAATGLLVEYLQPNHLMETTTQPTTA